MLKDEVPGAIASLSIDLSTRAQCMVEEVLPDGAYEVVETLG
jgi:hypothetical protein